MVFTTSASSIYTVATLVARTGNLDMKNERALLRVWVRVALWITTDTAFAPCVEERKLLTQYLRGVITIDQLIGLVEDKLQTAQAMEELRRLTAEATSRLDNKL
jgi:acyl CoA:acetate/3-ketoacid CoA transferase beta subunit